MEVGQAREQSTMIALLGAGAGSRLGGDKLNMLLSGKPLGSWALNTALQIGEPISVIVNDKTSRWLTEYTGRVQVIPNPQASSGLASSLRLAAKEAISRRCLRLLIVLADMPFVSAETLRRLMAHTSQDTATACSYDDGRMGPPACFGKSKFEILLNLAGDAGARHLLNQTGFTQPLTTAATELMDVDTHADMQIAASHLDAEG